jgi:hypothetical protein
MNSKKIQFKIKMFILNLFQRLALFFGAYIRPSRVNDISFIVNFLKPKNCGIELVMIGDGKDGTYVIPNDLIGIEKCFSPGVGPSSQFEEALYDSYGIKSYMIDASVASVPSIRDDFYVFEKKYLGASTYENFIDMNTWVNKYVDENSNEDLLLQMDIEGAEYSALLSCPAQVLNRFRIIAIEMHFLDALNLEFVASIFEQTIRKLETNFQVIYVHANDCCGFVSVGSYTLPRVIEVSLIRKDRIKDYDNDNSKSNSFVIKNL